MEASSDESSVCFQNQNKNPNSQSQSQSQSQSESQSESIAKGLSSTLTTVISDFDSRAQDTLKSQDHLSSAIDRLTRGLCFYFFYLLVCLSYFVQYVFLDELAYEPL